MRPELAFDVFDEVEIAVGARRVEGDEPGQDLPDISTDVAQDTSVESSRPPQSCTIAFPWRRQMCRSKRNMLQGLTNFRRKRSLSPIAAYFSRSCSLSR